MRLAATLTVTGALGFIILEALKILLAPAAVWLLGVVMFAVKALLVLLAVIVFVTVGVWAYKRWAADPDEAVA